MAATSANPGAESLPLRDRVAIVTGSSRGIGRAIAIHLAQLGAKLVINYTSNSAQADLVAGEINSSASPDTVPRAVTVQADISDPAQVKSLFDSAERAFESPVHVLVNSAGVLDPKYPSIANTCLEEFDHIFRSLSMVTHKTVTQHSSSTGVVKSVTSDSSGDSAVEDLCQAPSAHPSGANTSKLNLSPQSYSSLLLSEIEPWFPALDRAIFSMILESSSDESSTSSVAPYSAAVPLYPPLVPPGFSAPVSYGSSPCTTAASSNSAKSPAYAHKTVTQHSSSTGVVKCVNSDSSGDSAVEDLCQTPSAHPSGANTSKLNLSPQRLASALSHGYSSLFLSEIEPWFPALDRAIFSLILESSFDEDECFSMATN
ncbi:hypothetical protein JRO89_XS04G0127500 [Xanthoceras sorbifolium]|uniref:Uncharacterized protein n=1 Tax=Xanthoceras sorbifolium TaxID=99658 RepID=A0ABQ8I5U3_9ROSI|nr:hypothetical protein JRO89_XS04G0127500 [Xanthoceras sorbifolium]